VTTNLYTEPDCPDCGRVREWLRSNRVDFEERGAAASAEARRLAEESGCGPAALPLLEVDGRLLTRPSERELGLFFDRPLPREVEADCVIIGGGPAGLTAALYLARERVSAIVLEKSIPGGQVNTTALVENYPGFPQGVDGPDLMRKLTGQARRFGAEVLYPLEVSSLRAAEGGRHEVRCGQTVFRAPAVIVATGSDYRMLNVPGAKELVGRGVSYCATCDGPFYRNKTVAVVGGGNSAVEESLFLLKFVKEIHLFQNQPALTAQKHLVEKLAADPRVHVNVNSRVLGLQPGSAGGVAGIEVRDTATGREQRHQVQGVFVFIGRTPNTVCLQGYADLDEWGFVLPRSGSLETARRGLFAAGDCRAGAKAQITTAAGDGTVASFLVRDLLREREEPRAKPPA